MSVDGDTAVIGALADDIDIGVPSGAAFVFTRSGTTWTQTARLTPTVEIANARFGVSTAVSGGTAVVGASGANAAYVFVQSGSGWTQAAELKEGFDFGFSVSVDVPTAIVGTFQIDVAYIFDGAISGADGCYIDGALYASGDVNAANICEVCQPASSTTAWSIVTQGGRCDDGNPCHVGTCHPATGTCTTADVPDGTPCDDGNACTRVDTCQAGTCTGASPVTCPAPTDACHVQVTCNPVTGTCPRPPPCPTAPPATTATPARRSTPARAGPVWGRTP